MTPMAKFNQDSLKQKKYRATLNKLNRKSGDYGDGDGYDRSHQPDGSTKKEKASKNRGRKGEGGRKKGVPHKYPKKRDSRLN